MQKTHSKHKNKNEYSHPLVRSVEDPLPEDHHKITPSYQPIIANNQHRLSSKIARCTRMNMNSQREIGVVVAPFVEVR